MRDAGARLRVMTANLRAGRVDPARLRDLIAALAPDAAALQETSAHQADALRAVLPNGCVDALPGGTGVGLALARPAPLRRVPLPPRDGFAAEVVPVGASRGVEVVALHVVAPHTPPLWASLTARPAQVGAMEAYLERVRADHRVVLGDLNATPVWGVYRRLVAAGLADAARLVAAERGRRARRTWGPWSGAPRCLRIDHVLVSGLRVLDCRVVPLPGSDHSAVVADLAVPV